MRLFAIFALLLNGSALADSSSPLLAAYYDRQMAIIEGVAHGWEDDGPPRKIQAAARQVAVGRSAYYVLGDNGVLNRYRRANAQPAIVARDVVKFAAGRSGVLAIWTDRSLWWHADGDAGGQRIAEGMIDAAVGDGANYYVTAKGDLLFKGLAHRGQYGNSRLTETTDYVRTATGAASVYAHTGHTLYLARNGDVMGTGGIIYGPVGRHGLGDKAVRWSLLVSGASAVATGSSHSHAILADGTLMVWGREYRPDPKPMMSGVAAVAVATGLSLAIKTDGSIWQWDSGEKSWRVTLPGEIQGAK